MAFSRHDPPDGDHYMQISTFIEEENRWETVSSGRLIQAPCVFEAKGSLFVVGRTCAYPHEEFTALTKLYSEFSQGNTKIDPALIEKYHHGLRTGIFVLDGFRARQVAELLSAGDLLSGSRRDHHRRSPRRTLLAKSPQNTPFCPHHFWREGMLQHTGNDGVGRRLLLRCLCH